MEQKSTITAAQVAELRAKLRPNASLQSAARSADRLQGDVGQDGGGK